MSAYLILPAVIIPMSPGLIGMSFKSTERNDYTGIAFILGMTGWLTIAPCAAIILHHFNLSEQIITLGAWLGWAGPPWLALWAAYTTRTHA